MKLYLSSYRLGNETDKLVSMIQENKRAAVFQCARFLLRLGEKTVNYQSRA